MNRDDSELELGEEEEDEPEDIDLGSLGTSSPGGEPAKTDDEPDPKVELAKAQARAQALEEEIARRGREDTERAARRVEPPVRAVEAPARRSMADLVDDEFEREFIDSPKTGMKKLLGKMDEEVERRVAERAAPASVAQGMALVANFLRDKRDADAEEYAVAVKHFNARVEYLKTNNPQAFSMLVNAAPADAAFQLNLEWDAAYAKGERENREARKKEAATRRAAPPPALVGRGSPGGGVQVGGGRVRALSEVEEDMVRRGKAAGLSDADCKDLVREHRDEQRRLRGA
jgi:hypothetical protein